MAASDSLRKKWGTIFMGDREATMEQLDAMQEPVLRERQQRDQQQDYIERVRKRAADRAREILGEAYSERQKILAEAGRESEERRAQILKDVEALKQNAIKLHQDAEAELARAKAVGEEADRIRNSAHDEGFQSGMDQAGQELKEFRADMGNELARVMLAVEGQLAQISEFWRADLAELTRVAVQAGTGYILESEHRAVLENLVLEAVHLLERREVVSFRVNPEDEALVSDMFRAAREKAPELKQWIVNGDDSIERGGLIAESGSGSVDLRRQNFRELVDSILEHLTLPGCETERAAEEELHQKVTSAAERFAVASGGAPDPSLAPPPVEVQPPIPQEPEPVEAEAAVEEQPDLPDDIFSLEPDEVGEAENRLEEAGLSPKFEQDVLPQVEEVEAVPATPQQTEERELAQDLPSLAELEEELFPVNQDEEHEVLTNGGFLPEDKNAS